MPDKSEIIAQQQPLEPDIPAKPIEIPPVVSEIKEEPAEAAPVVSPEPKVIAVDLSAQYAEKLTNLVKKGKLTPADKRQIESKLKTNSVDEILFSLLENNKVCLNVQEVTRGQVGGPVEHPIVGWCKNYASKLCQK